MKNARLAEWIMFHRMYVRKYNAFLDMCPIGFKQTLDELDILSCERHVNRKKMLIFEATDDIARPEKIQDNDAYLLSLYRRKVVNMIIKSSVMYDTCPTRPLEPYEVYLLKDWLGIDYGRYLSVNYENTAL